MFTLDLEVKAPATTTMRFDTVTATQVLETLNAFTQAHPDADWSTLRLNISPTT